MSKRLEADGQEHHRSYFYPAEFRYDLETRVVSGVAMRYGDVAKMPWGDKERFAPGAFGDVDRADVVLDFMHERSRPLARTGGAGVKLSDSRLELRIEATLPNTKDADDALELVRAGVIRGFSVTFVPDEVCHDHKERMTTIEKAQLPRIALVDKPAYPMSKIDSRKEPAMAGEQDRGLDEDTRAELRKLVEEVVAENAKGDGEGRADVTGMIDSIVDKVSDKLGEQTRAQVEAALAERDAAKAAEAKAEEERKAAEAKAEADRKAAEEAAEDRAELLQMVTPLLPEDTETRGKSNHELLVLAVGDEVDGAEDRSEDYLLAKVEGIRERRDDAGSNTPPPSQKRHNPTTGQPVGGAGVNVARLIERKRSKVA